MSDHADANWWAFSLDEDTRGQKITEGPGGTVEVNPDLPDGRHLMDYSTYLGLDRILTAQTPASMTPDERIFVSAHQMFEIAFKQTIFDMLVLVETFNRLLEVRDDGQLIELCTLTSRRADFWLPAMTASSRIKLTCRRLLPLLVGYLGDMEGRDPAEETFKSVEFYKFRPFLPPASGFQSGQFRLIQRALGKENLFGVRQMPAGEYLRNYEGAPPGDSRPARVTDPVIMRQSAVYADPPAGTPLARVASLDDTAHQLLARLAPFAGDDPPVTPIAHITPREVERAVDGFRRILAGHRRFQDRAGTKPTDFAAQDASAVEIFEEDMKEAAQRENTRRDAFAGARAGAYYLHHSAPHGQLTRALNRLASADSALHGQHEDSFISRHYMLAARRIRDVAQHAEDIGEPEPPAGTGGGGVPYLGHVRKNLLPLFPALIAYTELEESAAWG